MRHFSHLTDAQRATLFHAPPEAFDRHSDTATLAVALGATLYMPATRPHLAQDLVRQGAAGLVSSVVCLEDSVADGDLPAAEANAVTQLRHHALRPLSPEGHESGPLVFVRVRDAAQITMLVERLEEHAGVITGFVLPKFTDLTGEAYLDALETAEVQSGVRLRSMPVLESPEIIYSETRMRTLLAVDQLLAKHRDRVLAVRVGAADLCSAFGIRRDRELTIYDVQIVAQVIADVVNVLGRADGSGYVVTGPVWEYFSNHERIFRPMLRSSPFADEEELRRRLLTRDLDGLIREVVLDKANGLTGKTVIHPSHVAAVHALSVVTHEEFSDASDILSGEMADGGVRASGYGNKMNEAKPHRAWATRIALRGRLFGVAREDTTLVDLLAAQVGS